MWVNDETFMFSIISLEVPEKEFGNLEFENNMIKDYLAYLEPRLLVILGGIFLWKNNHDGLDVWCFELFSAYNRIGNAFVLVIPFKSIEEYHIFRLQRSDVDVYKVIEI